MFYDYHWGTGSMYFRDKNHIPVWYFDDNGVIQEPVRFDNLGRTEQREIVHSRTLTLPDDWLICNGLILPSNYVDVARFEEIYRSHNRFRVFTASSKAREEELRRIMSTYHGVTVEDLEARSLCGDLCKTMFGTRDPRRLDAVQRVNLAQQLRRQYRMTFRQLATLVRLDEKGEEGGNYLLPAGSWSSRSPSRERAARGLLVVSWSMPLWKSFCIFSGLSTVQTFALRPRLWRFLMRAGSAV